MHTLILHEQVYKYVLSVKKHVQIIHNTKVKISITSAIFRYLFLHRKHIWRERSKFWNFGFLNASVNLQMFSANQVTGTICHFFSIIDFLTHLKFEYLSTQFSSVTHWCACFHLQLLKARSFFHYCWKSTFLSRGYKYCVCFWILFLGKFWSQLSQVC